MFSWLLIVVIVYLLCKIWQLKRYGNNLIANLKFKVFLLQAQKANMAQAIKHLSGVAANASKPIHYSVSKTERVRIPAKVKTKLKYWYKNSCAYCGVGVTKSTRTIDHIIPIGWEPSKPPPQR